MRIYVGNLSKETTRADLRDLFSAYGQIGRVGLAKEGRRGISRDCGLVEMKEDADGERAINSLDGIHLRDRPLTVREARMRAERKRTNDNNDG